MAQIREKLPAIIQITVALKRKLKEVDQLWKGAALRETVTRMVCSAGWFYFSIDISL